MLSSPESFESSESIPTRYESKRRNSSITLFHQKLAAVPISKQDFVVAFPDEAIIGNYPNAVLEANSPPHSSLHSLLTTFPSRFPRS